MPIFLVAAIAVGAGFIGYMFGKSSKGGVSAVSKADAIIAKLRHELLDNLSVLSLTRADVDLIDFNANGYNIIANLSRLPYEKALIIDKAAETNGKIKVIDGVTWTFVTILPNKPTDIKTAVKEAKKEEVKAEAKAILNNVMEGKTVKTKDGKLLVIRRGSKEGKWNLVNSEKATDIYTGDLSVEDIKSLVDDKQISFT